MPELLRILRLAPGTFPSFMRFSMTAAERARSEPVWFLAGLGADPAVQHRGLGTRLMRPALEQADATGHACLLNTQNERNIAYYKRFGFDVSSGPWRAGGAPTTWTMRRPPTAS
ncbi:GNAT family N-acetyltransferase [Nocardia brasiliensis]|uniref:GNAT family N-acetyltransferase n=1 Tax=Nocardia brasiliensis TaxID=37326 RepID=UPI003D94E85F